MKKIGGKVLLKEVTRSRVNFYIDHIIEIDGGD